MRRKIVLFYYYSNLFSLTDNRFSSFDICQYRSESADYCGVFFWTHAWKKRRAVGWILLWIAYRHIFWVLSRRICFTLYVHRLHQRIVQKKILPG